MPNGCPYRLVITTHRQIHVPGIHGEVRPAQGGHRVQEKQSPILVRQPRDFPGLIHGPSRRLIVHHGDQLVGPTGQLLGKGIEINGRTHGLERFGFAPSPLAIRMAISPNWPLAIVKVRSPRSTTLVMALSRPLRPEPGMGTTWFVVWNTCASISRVCS